MRLSEQLSSDSLDSEQILTHVNEYIKYSYNVNQIGISGNVETSEGEILVGLRDSKNIDDGYFYPSVNGNAEVYDENVQFYNNSVYEDLPTVNIHEKRSDLLGEIAREAYSELNMVSTKESWCCYGMIISGNLPQDKSSDRRCHFNVLFENEINEPFDEIKIRYRKASEAFETKNLAAIIIKCYKSRAHGLLFRIAQFLRYILRSKDFIESILLLLIASISIRNMDFSFENIDLSFENISSILSILFAGIILLTNFLNAIQYIAKSFQNLKSTKRICIYETMSYISLCRRISKAMKMKYHPATYASLKMHIENIIYSNLQNNRNLKKGISKN